VEDEGEPLRFRLDEDYQEAISFHRWFAMRSTGAARAAVAFTTSPEWLGDPEKLALVASGDDAAIGVAIAEGRSGRKLGKINSRSTNDVERLLDLCAGIGTMGATAARLGFDALSVEVSIVPHLIDRVLHDFAVSMADHSDMAAGVGEKHASAWRGLVAEVEDFANAVWRGTKERLKELFEEDVDTRLWVRITACPFCGRQVPLLSNARLSRDTALDISPDLRPGNDSEFPRFGLLRREFPDLKGTIAKGFCTCPACRGRFPFRGHDLIPLRSVPVAVRMRNSSVLSEIDSPSAYVRKVSEASYDSLAISSQNLGNRTILPAGNAIFHDVYGDPISVRNALLPRQRAYFAALAESMDRESALLNERSALTRDHRLAVRSAVALLISGQADHVNTYAHWLIDKPHPSTSAGPLTLGGLFTEVGGYWLERFWQNHLRHLLNLLQENSSSPRPVRAIQADAAEIPLDDSSVSAIVWDPPYYDNVDYDTAGEHYQAILAAMVPDLVDEPVVSPKLPRAEWTKRYEGALLRQAGEARRVVSSTGHIGVFWLARNRAKLQPFLDMIRPAGLHLRTAVRLDTIRPPRVATATGPLTYLLVLQTRSAAASAAVVDAETVLALAEDGALSLYDGLADLLESAWEPAYLDRRIPAEFHGSLRQRLAGFLASHPEPEQLLDELGWPTLFRELVNRGADRDEIGALDVRGLAQQLLARLGFAVARPARFSIREKLHECEKVRRTLELADSMEEIRGAFFSGFSLIEQILRYTSFAWSYLACGSQWNEALDQIISPATYMHVYKGPTKLNFGDYRLLFEKLPATFATGDRSHERELFVKISRALRKAKISEKLSNLVSLRNDIDHVNKSAVQLSLPQLRQKCSTVLAQAHTALVSLDSQQYLPVTVHPEEERRDRYGRRVLRLLDTDSVAIEVYVERETDLTEPLIYFASDSSRRDVYPKFIPAAFVEELLGLTEQDSRRTPDGSPDHPS